MKTIPRGRGGGREEKGREDSNKHLPFPALDLSVGKLPRGRGTGDSHQLDATNRINHRRRGFFETRARVLFPRAGAISICSSDRAKPSESKDDLNRGDRLPPWNLISSYYIEFARERETVLGRPSHCCVPLFARANETCSLHRPVNIEIVKTETHTGHALHNIRVI